MENRLNALLLICVITLIASCSSNKTNQSSIVNTIENEYTEDGKVRINFWTANDTPPVRTLVANFNQSQDKYFIDMTFKGSYSETLTAGIAAVKANSQPHLLLVYEIATGMMIASKDTYRDAHNILSINGGVDPDTFDIIRGVQSYFSQNGELQSFPFTSSTPVLIYNKDVLRKAKIDINNIEQDFATFETIEPILEQLKNTGFVPMTSAWGSFVFLETVSSMANTPFATQNNGLDGDFKKSRIELSELHLRTLETLENWHSRELYKYYGRDNASGQPFLAGNVGIILTSSGFQDHIIEANKFEYGVAYIPYFSEFIDEPKNSMVGGASIWALEGFSNEIYNGIAEFMKYVYSDKVMFEFHRDTGYLPLTEGSYKYGVKQGYYKNNPQAEIPYLQFTKPFGEYSQGWRLGNFVQIRTSYEETLEILFQGKGTPKDAFEYYQTRSNQLLDEFDF